MKIPKIDTTPKKTGGIIYPRVTTWDVVKEYAKLSRPYWLSVVFIVLGVIVAVISSSVIIPIFYKNFFDTLAVIATTSERDITPLIGIIFSILVLNLFNWLGWRVAWFTENYFMGHVRANAIQKCFDYTLKHSHSFFVNNFTGALTQKINRFQSSFDGLFSNIFFDLLTLVIKILGMGVILYITQPIIAYALGVWALIYLVISFFLSRMKVKYDIEAAALTSKLGGVVSDSISNHSSIQSFSAFKEEAKRVDNANTPLRDMNIFRWYFGNVLDAIQSMLVLVIEFLVFYYGIRYWQMGLVSLGTFVLVQTYITSIGTSLWGFSRIVRNIQEATANAKEMVEILHLKHEVQDIPNARTLTVEKGQIEFKDVSFVFGGEKSENKPVFTGMNMLIKPGEKVALIGSSGAGKSTLVKLLLRLYDVQKGEILVDGQDIKEVTQNSLRENISLVPQDPALFHRTLMENIRYGKRNATDVEVIEAAKLAHCDIFINEFPQKYETLVGERGVKLSGGERQRVAIARAILKNAPVLVLDEATSSLDSHSESLIQDALHTLMKGKTVIVIAHRLSTIRNMDRIIVVSKEGIVEEGSHDELLKKEGSLYAKLWSLQAGGFAGKSIEELLDE